jgi:flagellar secretion chaperone FliS
MYEAATKSYQEANFLSADPIKLVRMCYERAISSLKLARDSYIDRDYEAKGHALLKTLDIIHELNVSLDMEKGGEIAKNLRALYLFMTQSLIEADLKKDLAVFEDVIRMLAELESAWQGLASGKSGIVSPSLTVMPLEAKKTTMVSGAAVWCA